MRSGVLARLPELAEVVTPYGRPVGPGRVPPVRDYARHVFRRQQPENDPTLEESLEEVETRAAEAAKGRPTPKRRDAQADRAQRMKPPKDRREAYQMQRAKAKEMRSQTRTALLTGDDRHLPNRDKGPVRRFVRDWIDSRRTLGEFFILIGLVVVVANFIPNMTIKSYATTAWLALLVFLIGEGFMLSRRLKREIATRFPAEKGPYEKRRGAVFYGIMRSFQLRRLRLPKPRVTVGTTV